VRSFVLATVAGALVFSSASVALGNGRYPAANQLAFSPSDPDLAVLRTTFGILVSHDAGGTWHWLCEDVVGVLSSSNSDPVLAITNTSIVAAPGTTDGLAVSSDSGCDWNRSSGPLSGALVKDLVARPGVPDDVMALTSAYATMAGADGGPAYLQQVYESKNDGADWSVLGSSIDPTALVTSIELAASAPARVYVSAVRGANATRSASLFVSMDSGATWSERPVPIDPTVESEIFIGAVDPANADRVYVRTLGQPSRLLVSSDAGQTYQSALSLSGEMLGFALSEDGATIYAGSVEDGLFAGARESLAFQHVSTVHVQCLATHGVDVWACSDVPSGFIAGMSSDDGATFTAKAQLVAQPLVACPSGSSAAVQCSGAPWQMLCATLPGCPSENAGTAPANDGAPETAPSSSARAHGCAASGREAGAAALAVAGAFVAMAAWARRRTPRADPRGP
jgi:photosystem II stability/assembly factor-like uncharacterized protein